MTKTYKNKKTKTYRVKKKTKTYKNKNIKTYMMIRVPPNNLCLPK